MREFYAGLPAAGRRRHRSDRIDGVVSAVDGGTRRSPCRVGHPAKIRAGGDAAAETRSARCATCSLKLLSKIGFRRSGCRSTELRDLRALLLHRHQWVRMRTRVKNALQGLALAHGLRRGAGAVESRRPGDAGRVAACRRTPAHRRVELQALHEHLTDADRRARSASERRGPAAAAGAAA